MDFIIIALIVFVIVKIINIISKQEGVAGLMLIGFWMRQSRQFDSMSQ